MSGLAPLRRSVLAEVVLGAAVIAVTASLVNSVPARQDYVADVGQSLVAQDVAGDGVRVHLGVTPARAGRVRVTLTVSTPDGAPVSFASADGTVSDPDQGLGPITVQLRRTGPGTAEATGVVLPSPGLWHLVMNIRVDTFTDYAFATTFPLR